MSDAYETALLKAWGPQADSAHDIAHIRRVWSNCQALSTEQTDQDVLYASCIFHDLVNLPKDSPNRSDASRLSAEAAAPLLLALGFEQSKLVAVQHAIIAHSYSANIAPETEEALILQDADRLDALGAIGIARMFAISGALGRALYDPDDPLAQSRELDDTRFAIDHFETKLFKLPEMMNTEKGRALARARREEMRAFRASLLESAVN
ncbi:HD domain-containing protein [Lentibacter algarum]|uniref:HD domain-containing protein n=1 Tax=Lentibacter algarum TaxID=576131 RepID=UPI001C07EF7D|nr:HD domain-containing protein [Lentibacter algarum]MBU2982993.1 HD domain-containing protein [Lentibacter algarum]